MWTARKMAVLCLMCSFLITESCMEKINIATPSVTSSDVKVTASMPVTIQAITPQSSSTPKSDLADEDKILSRLSSGQYLVYNSDMLYAISTTDNTSIVLAESLDPRRVSLTFAVNGQFIAYQYFETLKLKIVNIDSHQSKEFDLNEECESMSLSSDGRWIACGVGSIYIYSLVDGEKFWLIPHNSEENLRFAWYGPAFSPDNKWIAYRELSLGYNKTAKDGLYLTSTDCLNNDNLCEEYIRGPFLGSIDLYEPFAWSPDGMQIAIITPETIIIFNTLTLDVFTLASHSLALDVAWSPDGEWIAFTGDGVNIISSKGGESPLKINDYSGRIGWIKIP